MSEQIAICRYGEQDKAFILNSWVRSYAARSVCYGKARTKTERDKLKEKIQEYTMAELRQMVIRLSAESPPRVTAEVYMASHNRLAQDLLAMSQCLVACKSDDRDHILGYIVFDPPDICHYIYVKTPFRRLGIARRLVTAAFPRRQDYDIIVTHWSQLLYGVFGEATKLIYDPYRGPYGWRIESESGNTEEGIRCVC